MRVLFVDGHGDSDDPGHRAARRHLIDAGVKVVHRGPGRRAGKPATSPYDAVIVAGGLGVPAVRALITRYPHTPVLVLGDDDDSLGLRFLESGCLDYLPRSKQDAESLQQALAQAAARQRGRIAFAAWSDERMRRLQLMQTLFAIISQRDLSPAEQIEMFLRAGCELFDMDVGVVSYIEGDIFVVEHAYSRDGSVRPGQQFELSETFSDITLQAHGPLGIHDLARSRWRDHPCRELGFRAYLGVPVQVTGRPYGTLGLSGAAPRREGFTEAELELIDTLGDWMGTLLTHSQLLGQLRLAATYDTLTGLPNRRVFISRLRRFLEHRKLGGRDDFALLFIDLDGFKPINDTLGHTAGDELLALVARRLEAHTMPKDTVARYAGDEFVALLAAVDRPQAQLVARRIRASFKRPFTLSQTDVTVGVSIGVATSAMSEDAAELIKAADAAMYRAKKHPDGVCVADPVRRSA